ncbi:MAG: NAD-dependent epimerase/dehydratase family protein [Thaumarchaeota archaeon]|nr:NAD-dependent epimerase/dehydratase family protein [Nitrososphaerota archaeon]
MSRVAITGGAGFLGSHIVRQQKKKGNEVIIVDNFSSGTVENLEDLGVKQDCIVGDLRDSNFAKKALSKVDTVYHFAAEVGSVEYLHGTPHRELDALQANLVIDANVFKACREIQANCIIYASSVSVYPFGKQLGAHAIFREEDATDHVDPEGGYGWSKFLGEVQLSMISGISVGVARIFHAYGENIYMKPDRSQVIASLISKSIHYPKDDFVVWGDGSQCRCFVFIDDVIDALEKLESYVRQKGKLTVNLGSQEEISVGELAQQIVRISGKKIDLRFDASRPSGAMSRIPDLERIKNTLGWMPKTKFQDGLTRTYNWAQRRLIADSTKLR